MLYASQCQILQLTVSLKFYYEKIKIKKEEKRKNLQLIRNSHKGFTTHHYVHKHFVAHAKTTHSPLLHA